MGTYGFASAGYFWSRLAAAVLVRMVYYLTGRKWSPEVLLYADDWIILAGRECGAGGCGHDHLGAGGARRADEVG